MRSYRNHNHTNTTAKRSTNRTNVSLMSTVLVKAATENKCQQTKPCGVKTTGIIQVEYVGVTYPKFLDVWGTIQFHFPGHQK